MNTWRQSAFRDFDRCPRKFHLAHVGGWSPRRSTGNYEELARIGTAVHKLIEQRDNGEPTESTKDAYVDNMFHNYVAWCAETGFEAGMEVVATEEKLEAEIPETPVTITGTVDHTRADKHRDNHHQVIDFKTKASFDPPHEADFQLRTYAWLYRATKGVTPAEVGHLQIRRIKDNSRAKKPFVDWFPQEINDHVLGRHEGHLRARAERMLRLSHLDVLDSEVYPVSKPSCRWDCSFSEVCPLMDEDDDGWERILEVHFTQEKQ